MGMVQSLPGLFNGSADQDETRQQSRGASDERKGLHLRVPGGEYEGREGTFTEFCCALGNPY